MREHARRQRVRHLALRRARAVVLAALLDRSELAADWRPRMSRRISIVGLGKLGASMAAAVASRGHEVWGVDVNERAVAALRAGEAPVQETGLQELITANRAKLHATMSYEDAIAATELTFVIVPTPSDARGA